MKNSLKKALALFSVIAILISALPGKIYATEPQTTLSSVDQTEATTNPIAQELISNELCSGITEILELREKNTKHFAMTDGTYKAISYSSAIHRKDKNGNWQDINNNLQLSSVKNVSLYTTVDERTSFSSTTPAFTLQENSYSISMSLKSNSMELSASHLKISNSPERSNINSFSSIQEARTVSNRSSVVYENVQSDINIEYLLIGNDIKENIIVKSRRDTYSYSFDLVLNGLTAALDQNGNILLSDINTNENVYIIPAPYMDDANGIRSYDVYYTLTSNLGTTYTLTVTADREWINDTCRAFPVTIDPTVSYVGECYDTYISATSPTENYGQNVAMRVSDTDIAYIYVPHPTLPDGTTNIGWVYLYVTYYCANAVGNISLDAYQILSPWNEDTLTWNCASDNANMGLATTPVDSVTLTVDESFTREDADYFTFDITELGTLWYSSTLNHGVALKRNGGTCPVVNIAAEEDGAYVSFLEINYQHSVPDGVYSMRVVFEEDTCEEDIYLGWVESADALGTVQGVSSSTNPAHISGFKYNLTFKISQVGTTSRYIIRLMRDNCLTFGISNNSVILKEIPPADADVSKDDTFYLSWHHDGFELIHCKTNYLLCYNSSTNSMELRGNSDEEGDTYILTKYTSYDRGVIERTPITPNMMCIGNTSIIDIIRVSSTKINYNTLEIVNDETYLYENHPYLVTEPGDIDLYWDINARQATIEWHHGEGRIWFIIKNPSDDIGYSTYLNFNIGNKLDGIYYIRNGAYDQYLQAEPFKYSMAKAEMKLKPFNEEKQQWRLEYNANGCYSIISVKSGLALSIASSSAGTPGKFLIQLSDQKADNQLWKITLTEQGTYIIRPKSGISQNLCAKGHMQGTVSAVTQLVYVADDNDDDEWFLAAKSNSVKLENQEKSKWCWVACARMMCSFYIDSHISQEDAVTVVKSISSSDNNNVTGTLQDISQAIEYILTSDDNTYFADNRIYSEQDLINILGSTPVVAYLRRTETVARGKNSGGHFVVIYGYDSDTNKFKIHDPANVDDKITQASYQELCTGIVVTECTETECTKVAYIWQGVLVFKVGNYENTIPII